MVIERLWKKVIPTTLRVFGAPLASVASLGGQLWEKLHHQKPESPEIHQDLLVGEVSRELDRPLLIVPGFNYRLSAFHDLTEKLTENGANGARPYFLRDGQVFLDEKCSTPLPKIPSEARIFIAALHNPNDPPPASAPQVGQDLEMILQATGQAKVDVAAHSMGGLATRKYLDHGGTEVGRFLMVGTPNQGATLAYASLKLLDYHERGWPVSWLMAKQGVKECDRPAYEWLSPHGRDKIQDLNSRAATQLARVEQAEIMGGSDLKTYGSAMWKVAGDGTVPATALEIPGWTTKLPEKLDCPKHARLFDDPQVYREMADFFQWRATEPASLRQ